MRLEQENDDLAHELVTSKIALRKDLDNVRVSDWFNCPQKTVGRDCLCVSSAENSLLASLGLGLGLGFGCCFLGWSLNQRKIAFRL